jgi:hypothetical protein
MLLEVIKTKRGHRRLPYLAFDLEKTFRAGVPLLRRRQALAALRPPKRLFGFASDIAPREANIVQIAVAPPRQFKPLTPALAPNVERFAELGEKPQLMMICHRLR